MQGRNEKELREAVLTAERLLMLLAGVAPPVCCLHAAVLQRAHAQGWPPAWQQAAWNVVNDWCALSLFCRASGVRT